MSIPAALAVLVGAGVAIAATPRSPVAHGAGPFAATDPSRKAIEEITSISCANGDRSCAAEIYTVPEQYRFELRSVACDLKVRAPGRLEDGAVLFSRTARGSFGPIAPVRLAASDDHLDYGFDTRARVTGSPGARLVVGVNTDNDVSEMTCRFAGDLVAAR